MDGAEWLEEVTEDTTIDKLKEKCLKQVGLGLLVVSPLSPFFVLSLLHVMFAACHVFCALSVSLAFIYSCWVALAIYN